MREGVPIHMRRLIRVSLVCLCGAASLQCLSESPKPSDAGIDAAAELANSGTGGGPSTDGTTASGGIGGTGGLAASGGTAGSGSITPAGGAVGIDAANGTGGFVSLGGTVGAGGATGLGGTT